MAQLVAVPRVADPNRNRLTDAEGRLRALVAEVHAAASEVLAAAAEVRGTAAQAAPVGQAEGPMLLTVDQVAEQLGISASKCWQLVASGEIESVNVGRTRRVRAADLAKYVEGL